MPEVVLLNACRDNLKHVLCENKSSNGQCIYNKYPSTVLQSMTNTMHSQIQSNDILQITTESIVNANNQFSKNVHQVMQSNQINSFF